MSIKLTLLKTGEQLISEMKELVPEDQEQVHAYLLDNPHTVEINEKQFVTEEEKKDGDFGICLLYTSPSPRDVEESRMPSSA